MCIFVRPPLMINLFLIFTNLHVTYVYYMTKPPPLLCGTLCGTSRCGGSEPAPPRLPRGGHALCGTPSRRGWGHVVGPRRPQRRHTAPSMRTPGTPPDRTAVAPGQRQQRRILDTHTHRDMRNTRNTGTPVTPPHLSHLTPLTLTWSN